LIGLANPKGAIVNIERIFMLFVFLVLMEIFVILKPGLFIDWSLEDITEAFEDITIGRRSRFFKEQDMMVELDDAKIIKLAEEQIFFFKATESLIRSIDETKVLLKNEIDKSLPDPQKITQLREDLSRLEACFNEHHEHYLAKKKEIIPNFRSTFFGRGPVTRVTVRKIPKRTN